MSSARSAPTLSLIWPKPCPAPPGRGGAACRRRSRASRARWHRPGYPSTMSRLIRSSLPASASRRIWSAWSGVSASLRYRKSTRPTISSGDISASSRHSGLPARLAFRSHRALTTAEIAMCMTPFSGPSHRSCESCDQLLVEPAQVLDVPPDHVRLQRADRRRLHVVAAPDGEREPVPVEPVVRRQHHVGRGVVGIGVHRVGPVELPRGGKAHVMRPHPHDPVRPRAGRRHAWPMVCRCLPSPPISSSTTSPARR